MRFLVTLCALALSTHGWSAELGACSNTDASAALAKFRQHIMPAPEAPQHRWMVSQAHAGWEITEYSGFRVFIRCKPMTKADELNGVQYGEIEFQYDASRSRAWPELTSSGLKWTDWTEWTDHLQPLTRAQKAEAGPIGTALYDLVHAGEDRDRRIPFRKFKGKIQLAWEYSETAARTLKSAADVNRFLNTADAEAAKMRAAEAEQVRQAEEARLAREAARARDPDHVGPFARLKRPANPDDYYPPGSIRREEQGSPVVKVCVGPSGTPLREPVVTDTSGFPELDAAAVKVAQASRYFAATENGSALPESCVRFSVNFTLHNN